MLCFGPDCCITGARRDYEAAGSALGGHDAVELAHHVHTDFEGLPLLALGEELLAALGQHQINAAIWTGATELNDLVVGLDRLEYWREAITLAKIAI